MDPYSWYNQIAMAKINKKNTIFMNESHNYYYNEMSFSHKNTGETYQRRRRSYHNQK